MSTWWNSQQGEGEYTLQFGTDNRAKFRLVEKAAQMAIDGKTIADVAETKHGEWIDKENPRWRAYDIRHCSNCGWNIPKNNLRKKDLNWNYCPHCGARMDGGKEE